ncbi:uncharacterized protein LOC100832749 [Brachypodium distachyon]|uniref:DUF1618 domain-containing protein n=1 Tax=Brachypodium distachyon TaxID=15368 RepID=A0A0Q3JZF4_BRADI|nr:uncharacterized protein LOC100832749 [Brachypodium distachyon]KQK03889.2 hypothetical protein BRADI_2g10458v3 [Brachypodium distachyon]|eukprot:XP_003565653.2 uncharacterized protein LOC100832749 [Brachypodium distachyon]
MAPPSSSSTSSAPPPSSWVILGSIPRVSGPADEGDEVSVALTAPPRVSILTVSPRVFPEPATPHHFPFVLAADPSSGLLLLQANLGCPATREVVDRPNNQSVTWRLSTSRYFVLDAAAGSAFHLPDPEPAHTILHQAMLGLLASPAGDGHYMVAELQPIIGSDKAELLCFSTEVGEWVEKPVHYLLPPRPLAPICVVSHHGRLWWVDLSWGVIHCDPFAVKPVLGFVPFPPGRVLECREAWGVTDKYRYVGVSGGKLRFVDTYVSQRARGGAPTVSVWTLADPDSTEWTLEHEATFADIWADKSYKATRLPKKIPVLALIHPKNPCVVYFFLEKQLFGVDVRAHKIVECKVYGLVAPPSCYIANRFVRAWELPQTLPSGMLNWCKGINLAEKAKGRPTQPPSPGDYHLVGHTRQTFVG